MSFNLINQIPAEDKAKIEKFISLYGVRGDSFIGIDSWLKPWSDNKIKMYKLLGNQLIYRTPFNYKKSEDDLRFQLRVLVDDSTKNPVYDILNWFKQAWVDYFIDEELKECDEYDRYNDLYLEIRSFIYDCFAVDSLAKDSICRGIKFKARDYKKTFQIQKGAKPIRSFGKFLTYCKDMDGINDIMKKYEEFRIAHSMIFNDKEVKGTLAISIHPLDFMTMSDNNSNWHSCMSWINDGCYHVGTVEMMNSNNVLCCYIENTEPFYFNKDEVSNLEEYRWANKKWRQLVYFTKDIIVSGKPYPYHNDEFSKFIIGVVRDLAEKNLKWTYSFGPELYQDMKHINGNRSMLRAKKYIKNKDMKKHNIIFDTKGMYNDMLNDNDTNYWCFRNKVKHNKVISYSGKAPCLCCGDSALRLDSEAFDDWTDYNDRYRDTGELICKDCLDEFHYCDICGDKDPTAILYTLYNTDEKVLHICKDCAKEWIRLCPECGDKMFNPLYNDYYNFVPTEERRYREFIKLNEKVEKRELEDAVSVTQSYLTDTHELSRRFKNIYPICRCKECSTKDAKNFDLLEITADRFWYKMRTKVNISKKVEDKSKWDKFFIDNLKETEVKDGEIIKL